MYIFIVWLCPSNIRRSIIVLAKLWIDESDARHPIDFFLKDD